MTRNCITTFLESIEPNKKKIIGCILKYPNVPVTELADNCMGPILQKLSRKKKEMILMGDFNINILICNSDIDTGGFVDTIYTSS